MESNNYILAIKMELEILERKLTRLYMALYNLERADMPDTEQYVKEKIDCMKSEIDFYKEELYNKV